MIRQCVEAFLLGTLAVVLSAMMLFHLSGCGGAIDPNPNPQVDPQEDAGLNFGFGEATPGHLPALPSREDAGVGVDGGCYEGPPEVKPHACTPQCCAPGAWCPGKPTCARDGGGE